jgi:hypothetical protein
MGDREKAAPQQGRNMLQGGFRKEEDATVMASELRGRSHRGDTILRG